MKKVSAKQVDRELLDGQSKDLLKELHLLTRDGQLNADARRKLKQINHFAGFLQEPIADIFKRHEDCQIVDVASGNAYLGFIIYELCLKNRDSGHLHSVERDTKLYEQSLDRAQRLQFDRMSFICSEILSAQIPDRVHILTALHACDTATDEAIALGVRNQVDYLFLVPCCQAEVAKLLKHAKVPPQVAPLFEHNHHRREFGSHLTNVIRVLFLKANGYQVRVTELTSWEHTAKGEFILAKRVQKYDPQAQQQYSSLLEYFGIEPWLARRV